MPPLGAAGSRLTSDPAPGLSCETFHILPCDPWSLARPVWVGWAGQAPRVGGRGTSGVFPWSRSPWRWVSYRRPGNAGDGEHAGIHTVPCGPRCPAQLPARLLTVCRRRGPCEQPPRRPPVTGRAGGRSSPDTHPSRPPVSAAPPEAQRARAPAPLFTSRKPSLTTQFKIVALPALPPPPSPGSAVLP